VSVGIATGNGSEVKRMVDAMSVGIVAGRE
jgi:hypothetical protein